MQRSISEARRNGVSGRRSSTLGFGSLTCLIATVRKLSPGYGGAGQQLVEDDPERVDVGLGVDLLAASLFGSDVVARAEDVPLSVWPTASSARAIPKSVTLAGPLRSAARSAA